LKLQRKPEWLEQWNESVPPKEKFLQGLKDDPSSLLFQTLDFVSKLLDEQPASHASTTICEEEPTKRPQKGGVRASMSLRQEKITNLCQQLSDTIKSTRVASSLGYRRALTDSVPL
jgi:hypothetical protein